MLTKENIISTISTLEEPLILDDVLEKIFLLEKISKGLEQSKNDKIIKDDEIDNRIESWLV